MDKENMYLVVKNSEDQYSILQNDKIIPKGWYLEGENGTKAECLEYIRTKWSDIRPESLKTKIKNHPVLADSIKMSAKGKHEQMIFTYQKRYQYDLDSWSNYDSLKECIKLFFSKYGHLSKNKEVFEIGIGTGISSEYILQSGFNLTGIDVIENKNWKNLREKYPNQIATTVGDILEFKSNKKFDIVLDNGCFHHFEPEFYKPTLSKMHELLNENGYLFLAIFEEPNYKLEVGHLEFLDGGKRRCKFFTKNEISELLGLNGFALEYVEKVGRGFDNTKTMLCIAKRI